MIQPMTSRERVNCVLRGEQPDRVPFNFWMDRDKMAEYDARWGGDFRLTHYGADVIEAFVLFDWFPGLHPKSRYDGVTCWQLEPALESMEQALELQFADPADPAHFTDIRTKRANHPDKAIFSLMVGPLGILSTYRLAQNLFLELHDKAEVIHEFLRMIQPIYLEIVRRICALDIDVLYLADDICDRNGATISPAHLREFHFDYLRPAIDIAHQSGKRVFYHTDGYVLDILDIFTDYNIDGINPIEHRYNDPKEFLRRSGGRLKVYGALDNCNVIPNGTPDEIKAHVQDVFHYLGANGLIMSTHDIPAYCPLENLDAMVEAVKGCSYARNANPCTERR